MIYDTDIMLILKKLDAFEENLKKLKQEIEELKGKKQGEQQMSLFHDYMLYGKMLECAIFSEIFLRQTGAFF